MRRSVRYLLGLATAFVLAACGNGESADSTAGSSTSSDATSEETLYIGMEAAYPPYNWSQQDESNGALQIQNSHEYANGYDVQMSKLIGEALDRPVEIVKVEWSGLIPALQANKIDLVIAGMSPTKERQEAIELTESYYDAQFTMVTRVDSEYADGESINDYDGARLVGQQGTLNYDLLNQFPGATVEQAMNDFSAMRVALQSRKIDAYISEYPESVSATRAIDDLSFIELPEGSFEMPEGTTDYLAIGIKKGNLELLEQVNEVLAGITPEERSEMMNNAIDQQPSEQ